MRLSRYILMMLVPVCLTACNKEIDYVVEAEWIYINSSAHTVEVAGRHNFTIEPGSSHTINQRGEGGENPGRDSFAPPLNSGTTVVVGGKSEIVMSGGFTDLANYSVEQLAKRRFRFTYSFTD